MNILFLQRAIEPLPGFGVPKAISIAKPEK